MLLDPPDLSNNENNQDSSDSDDDINEIDVLIHNLDSSSDKIIVQQAGSNEVLDPDNDNLALDLDNLANNHNVDEMFHIFVNYKD